MSLWGAIQKAKNEGRLIRLQSEKSQGFPPKDFIQSTTDNETTFQIACMNLEDQPQGNFIPYLEEILYDIYFKTWQHYHLSQSSCQNWFMALFCARHLQTYEFKRKETIFYQPLIRRGEYSLGKNTVLGTRILTIREKREIPINFSNQSRLSHLRIPAAQSAGSIS